MFKKERSIWQRIGGLLNRKDSQLQETVGGKMTWAEVWDFLAWTRAAALAAQGLSPKRKRKLRWLSASLTNRRMAKFAKEYGYEDVLEV